MRNQERVVVEEGVGEQGAAIEQLVSVLVKHDLARGDSRPATDNAADIVDRVVPVNHDRQSASVRLLQPQRHHATRRRLLEVLDDRDCGSWFVLQKRNAHKQSNTERPMQSIREPQAIDTAYYH